jgi:hypothetical protein
MDGVALIVNTTSNPELPMTNTRWQILDVGPEQHLMDAQD